MEETDFLIVGGGTAGCVVASRLKEYLPTAQVTLLEAGTDEHENPLVTEPMGGFALHNSPLEYNYTTEPQEHYGGRRLYHAGVKDDRWSYEGLRPFFKKVESHHDPKADPEQHGHHGPMRTTAGARKYPLRNQLLEAMHQATGLSRIQDANNGDPTGISEYTENWTPEGKRQPSGVAYGLKGVEVMTSAPVHRLILEGNTVRGAELISGRKIFARREVILSCGSIRSPQVLMLSGIGPTDELKRHRITPVISSPEVGSNLSDHCTIALYFKIRNTEKGYAAGSALWTDPSYMLGMPVDLAATKTASLGPLKHALVKDGVYVAGHPHLKPNRAHFEIVPAYAPAVAPKLDIEMPFDGSIITLSALNLMPTSRGSIKLASAHPDTDPLIDPNYYATEADRVVLREAIRTTYRIAESSAGQAIIEAEVPPKGYPVLHSESSDKGIDDRVKRAAATWFHTSGTCSMGKVVDRDLKVIGVENLRVVDASIMPCPIAGPFQVPVYTLAEQAAVIIQEAWTGK